MPFATEFKTKLIIKNAFGEIPEDIWKWEPYRKKIWFFNKLDKSNLLYFRMWCENPSLKPDSIYRAYDYSDKKNYVYEGNKPAYHKYECCPNLHSNFKNFKIPQQIKDMGDDKIKEFRNWFKENEEIFTKYNDQYKLRLKVKYGIDAFQNDLVVNFENSGSVFKENLTLERIEKRIDSILDNYKYYFLSNEKRKKALSEFQKKAYLFKKDYKFINNSGYSDIELKNLILELEAWFIKPTIEYLQEYYKIYYCNDIEIQKEIFEALNFKPCGHCYSADYKPKEEIESRLPKLGDEFNTFELSREPGIFNFKEIHEEKIKRCFVYAKYIKLQNEFINLNDNEDNGIIVEFLNHKDKFLIKNAHISEKSKIENFIPFNYYILQIDKHFDTNETNYILHE